MSLQVIERAQVNGQCYDVAVINRAELPSGTRGRVDRANDAGIGVSFIQGMNPRTAPDGYAVNPPDPAHNVLPTTIDGKAYSPIYLPPRQESFERSAIVVYRQYGNGPCPPGVVPIDGGGSPVSAFWQGIGGVAAGLAGLGQDRPVQFPTWAKWTIGVGSGALALLLILRFRR